MNVYFIIPRCFKTCKNVSDAVPLYLPQQLYLKPLARLNVSLQLPNVRKSGKSISHWEIMDKLRALIKPDEFTELKVTKTTVEFVRFEAEVELRSKLARVVSKLDGKTINLKEFNNDVLKLRAAEARSEFPNRRIWDAFFQEARDMNEMKPGERPDTVYLANLPKKWFGPYHSASQPADVTVSEKTFKRIFEKFGKIRFVDIPICDPYRKKMKPHISGIRNPASDDDSTEFFEAYVQFHDYIGFTKAMDALRDMKLLHKEDVDEVVTVNIKVDFDKTKHLSEATIRRREIVRDRLMLKAKEQEERDRRELEDQKRKEQVERQKEIDVKVQKGLRRKLREEKRKAKILQKLQVTGTDEINEKIAKEEKKLLKVQRKLEAIRLVEELFRRIKEKNHDKIEMSNSRVKSSSSNGATGRQDDELKTFKDTSELEVLNQREKLHHAIKGRVVLKSILSDNSNRARNYSSSSSNSSSSSLNASQKRQEKMVNSAPVLANPVEALYDPTWYGFPFAQFPPPGAAAFYPSMRGVYHARSRQIPGPSRGSPFMRRPRGGFRGGYRGGNRRFRYPPELEEEYEKYFAKFLHEHDDRRSRRSRSLSSRPSRRRSYSRSTDRRSYSHSRSPDRRSRSRAYKQRTRSRSRTSYSRSRSRSRSQSRSSRSKQRRKRRSRSKKRHSKSSSHDKSVDSSKFVTPQQMRSARSRSKSWSLPKEADNSKPRRSWSKTPEKKD